MENQKGLKHGIYKIHWASGGSSLASIGFTHDGTNWFAPCNWTNADNENPLVASTEWKAVDRIELLIENNYNTDESPEPSPTVVAGKDKPFIVANVREITDLYDKEEISYSRMVEMLNEIAFKFAAASLEGGDAVELEDYTKWVHQNWIVGTGDLWRRQSDYRDQRTNRELVQEYQLFIKSKTV